jgi:hypothetical protein
MFITDEVDCGKWRIFLYAKLQGVTNENYYSSWYLIVLYKLELAQYLLEVLLLYMRVYPKHSTDEP